MSELLSLADRTELERINTDNLPDRARIERVPATLGAVTAGGNSTLTPVLIAAAEPCRVAPAADLRELTVAEQRVALASRMVSFAVAADLSVRDRITLTMSTGETLAVEVIGVSQPHSYAVLKSCLVQLAGTP